MWKQPSITQLSLKDLTLKLTFLLLILSGKRGQTIHLLSLDNMVLSETKCEFVIMEKVKQTRVGHHIPPIVYEAFPHDPNLCSVNHLNLAVIVPEMCPLHLLHRKLEIFQISLNHLAGLMHRLFKTFIIIMHRLFKPFIINPNKHFL